MRYRGESYPHMISIASTLIHFGLRLELAGELLEQEEDNLGAAEASGKAERSESVLRSKGREGLRLAVE
jgi:hypothetical protein